MFSNEEPRPEPLICLRFWFIGFDALRGIPGVALMNMTHWKSVQIEIQYRLSSYFNLPVI